MPKLSKHETKLPEDIELGIERALLVSQIARATGRLSLLGLDTFEIDTALTPFKNHQTIEPPDGKKFKITTPCGNLEDNNFEMYYGATGQDWVNAHRAIRSHFTVDVEGKKYYEFTAHRISYDSDRDRVYAYGTDEFDDYRRIRVECVNLESVSLVAEGS